MLIGELSRRTGVSTRLLRYYEGQGLLEARRGPNGYRSYDEDAVATVRKIRALLAAWTVDGGDPDRAALHRRGRVGVRLVLRHPGPDAP